MRVTISSTEAIRRFGDCLARIRYRGDSFVITRNEVAVAELVAVGGRQSRATWGELVEALRGLPHDVTFADDLERVNAADRVPENPWA